MSSGSREMIFISDTIDVTCVGICNILESVFGEGSVQVCATASQAVIVRVEKKETK